LKRQYPGASLSLVFNEHGRAKSKRYISLVSKDTNLSHNILDHISWSSLYNSYRNQELDWEESSRVSQIGMKDQQKAVDMSEDKVFFLYLESHIIKSRRTRLILYWVAPNGIILSSPGYYL